MKFSNYIKLVFISSSILFTACGKNTSGSKSSAAIANYSEDLTEVRPKFEYSQEESPVEEEKPVKVKNNDKPATEPQNDNAQISKVLNRIAMANEQITDAQGYRISIFSGNSRSDFEAAKSYILQYFPELQIYESYSQPTYKIKVGDFMKRIDAEKYYSSLNGRFNSSRIIRDKIAVQKSFEIGN